MLMAAVDLAGCGVQPLIVGARAPQKAKDGRREKGGPQESLTHPGTAAVEKAQVVECAWGPPGPLTCHPSSPSGESLGWFPRLC